MMITANELLAPYRPCETAIHWMGRMAPCVAWKACRRGDWLMWAATRLGAPAPAIARAACACAKLIWPYAHGHALLQAILTVHIAEEWAAGREDGDTVTHAIDAASSVGNATDVAGAVDADIVAADAAYAAADAARITVRVWDAATRAVCVVAQAADSAGSVAAIHHRSAIHAQTKMLADCAKAIRCEIPNFPLPNEETTGDSNVERT